MFSNWIVELSQWQFVLISTLHFVFVPLTLGLGVLLAALETAAVVSNRDAYLSMIHFWKRIFALNGVLMLSTRLPWMLQFGLYDSYFAHYAGDVFALPLALEVLTSLIIVASLFGPYWFGWDKLDKYLHLAITWLIAIAVHVSVFWYTLCDAWLQNPVGVAFDANAYRLEMIDFSAILHNPIVPSLFTHLCAASHAAAAAAMLAVCAYRLKHHRADRIAGSGFKIAACWGLLALLITGLAQDQALYLDTPTQAGKRAALEQTPSNALQETLSRHIRSGIEAYRLLESLRDDNNDPQLLAEFAAHQQDLGYAWLLKPWHKPIVNASDKHIHLASQAALPSNPNRLYWLHKILLICGMTSFLGFGVAAWMSFRQSHLSSPALTLIVYSAIFPWLAAALDLWLSISGLQPWVIAGLLPAEMAFSTSTATTLAINFTGYAGLYTLLLLTAGLLLKRWLPSPPPLRTLESTHDL